MPKISLRAIMEREDDRFVALSPELNIASQGATVEEATANLQEAVELFLECADPAEIEARRHLAARDFNPSLLPCETLASVRP